VIGTGENNGTDNGLESKRAGRCVAALFDEHSPSVFSLCRLILRDRSKPRTPPSRGSSPPTGPLLGGTEPREPAVWLAQIARNECRARLRRRELAAVPLDVEPEDDRDASEVASAVSSSTPSGRRSTSSSTSSFRTSSARAGRPS
jgi:hypothetical protein